MPYAEISQEDRKKIRVETLPRHKDLIQSIPGSRYDAPNQSWLLPLSWAACVQLRGTFGLDLEIGSCLAEWAQEEVDTRIAPTNELRELVQFEDDVNSDPKYRYQKVGSTFLATAKQALLIDPVGAGKTRQAIHALEMLHTSANNDGVFPCLVIGKASGKITWGREFNNLWSGIEVQVVKGSAATRRKQLEAGADVFVMNWEALRMHSRLAPYGSIALKKCRDCGGESEKITPKNCQVCLRELNFIDFKSFIADEIHSCLDPSSAQTRAAKFAVGNAEYRYGMTATAISEAIGDLWSPLNLIAPWEWPSKSKYIDRYCETAFSPWGAPTIIGLKANRREEFFKIVNSRIRRMPAEIVLSFLPPRTFETRYIEMSPKQHKAYEQMRLKSVAELDGEILTATTEFSKLTRQTQFASSFGELYEVEVPAPTPDNPNATKTESRVRLIEPSNKIDAFIDDIPDFGTDSVIVFATSRQLIELLSTKLEKHGIEHAKIVGGQTEDQRQAHIDDFQGGKVQFILVVIKAGGTGLTLTKARGAVFLQMSWSPIEMTQALGRNYRIGSEQHDSIWVRTYVTEKSVEIDQIEALEEKAERLEEITRDREIVRNILRRQRDKEKDDN